jgi:hypothetical protein
LALRQVSVGNVPAVYEYVPLPPATLCSGPLVIGAARPLTVST